MTDPEPDATEDDSAAVDTDEMDDPGDSTERDDAHLQNVEPGAGCTEIWEHLSENRDE
jgi:hypothetical protein